MLFHRNAIKLVFIMTKRSPNKGSFFFATNTFTIMRKRKERGEVYADNHRCRSSSLSMGSEEISVRRLTHEREGGLSRPLSFIFREIYGLYYGE